MSSDSLRARWREYRPSKALFFWSCAVCIAGTVAVGFVSGSWVTASSASRMADDAAQTARAKLAANYCVDRFESSADAAKQLAALKETESWRRDDFVVKGGWVTPPGTKVPVTDAADLCVQQLLVAKLPLGNTAATPSTRPVKTGG